MSSDDSASAAVRRAAARRTRQSSEGALIASADEGARALRREEARMFAERQLRAYEAELLDVLDALVVEVTDAIMVARRALELYGDDRLQPRERLFTRPAALALVALPGREEVERRLADVRRKRRRVRPLSKRLRWDVD
jgi:hypothetical protein